ncbi:NAD-dependent epimerase/dehydratase family protein [Thermodesulfobacteriota bacterium]
MIKPNNPKMLVTGGGGFLGYAIVRRLVDMGCDVTSFSRRFYPELEALEVGQIQGDIRDKLAVEKALIGIDVVFHVAAKPGVWGKYADYYDVNVTGTLNIIEGCIFNKVSKLIYTSSPSVVFDGNDMEGVDESALFPKRFHGHYPKTKAIAEQAVASAASDQLRSIALRPHLIWGPRDNHLAPRIIARAKRLVRVGNGENRVDTIYIDNAAEAHILAAMALDNHPNFSGNVYFISQDCPVRLWDMVNAILKVAGHPPVKRSVSRRTAWLIGALFEAVYTLFRIKAEPQMTRFVANELATSHFFNIDAAKRDLRYKPTVSTEEGLKRLEAWLKEK